MTDKPMKVWSWRQAVQKSELAATTKLVLLNLSIYMNEHGDGCYPSIEQQCKDTSLSNKAIITHLNKAVDAGFLIKKKHGFGGQKWMRNEYEAIYPKGSELDDKAVNLREKGSEPQGVKAVNEVHTNTPLNSPDDDDYMREDKSIDEQVVEIWREVEPIMLGRCLDPSPITKWVEAGGNKKIILQTIQMLLEKKGGSPPTSLRYFEQAVADAIAYQKAPMPIGEVNAPKPARQLESFDERQQRLNKEAGARWIAQE